MTTILHLEFPDFSQKYFNFIEINSQIVEITKGIHDIIIKKIINREHFIEKIKIYNNDTDYVEHKIKLYINRKNNFYCFIGSKYGFTFEIFNYDKIKLMENLEIKQNNIIYNLKEYDTGGLSSCRRFNIINCSKECIDYDKFGLPKLLPEGSYSINIFYHNISIEKLKQPKYYEINFDNIKNKDYFLNLEVNVNRIYKELRDDKNTDDYKDNKFYVELKKILGKNEDCRELEKLKIILAGRRKIIFNQTEYNICFGYAFLTILRSIMKFPYILFGIFSKILNDLKKNIPNSLDIIRILFWYDKYYLKNDNFIEKIRTLFYENKINLDDDKDIQEIHDFKLIYPNKCKKDTPYKKCYDFLHKFITELNEDSFLLEILLLLDSDSASNRRYRNVRIFQLSLLSLSQIKEHLMNIIPDVVIRKFHSQNDESNGNYLPSCGIMECFEGSLYEMNENKLNLILIETEDNECKYTMPLIMLFMHELFGHAKHRLDCWSLSPTHFYNPHNNYKLSYHCFEGESGRLFEFYISPDINIIKYLQFSLFPNKDLLLTKLWVAQDLRELRNIVKEKINYYKFECEKKIAKFPNGFEEQYAILVNTDENIEFFSDSANAFYDNDGPFNPYRINMEEIISCI